MLCREYLESNIQLSVLILFSCYFDKCFVICFRGVAVATFKHHTAPITSVEWQSRDSTVFAASGADDQLTLWDLAVERDDNEDAQENVKDLPPQLLFIHMVSLLNIFLSRRAVSIKGSWATGMHCCRLFIFRFH